MMREPRTPWPAHVEQPARRPPALDAAAPSSRSSPLDIPDSNGGGQHPDRPDVFSACRPFNRFGPRRVRQPAVRFEDLPPISTVLLSHNHYDHCDVRTLRLLAKRFDPIVVTPLGNRALVRSAGIRRVEEIDWWQEATTSALPITLTPAHHFSARTPLDRNRALWGGFMLSAAGARIFFAGDTRTDRSFARSAIASGRSISPLFLSAPMSHAGSCSPCT